MLGHEAGNTEKTAKAAQTAQAASTAGRRWLRPLLAAALLGVGGLGAVTWNAAVAQVAYSNLTLNGTPVQSVTLYGAEYVDIASLRQVAEAYQEGPYIRISGYGHTLLLPIDEDAYRATTEYNTLQLDTLRIKGRAATYVDGNIHVPVEVVARTFGATYSPGSFSVPAAALTNVSSSVGTGADRLVLDLSRDADVFTELRGNDVHVVLRGVSGTQQRYTTSGKFISNARVVSDGGGDLRLRFSLPKDSGYRMYKVIRPGSVRVVVDAGPSIERTTPALLDRISRPQIVLEPVKVEGAGRDFTMDVANKTRALLKDAGWEVKMTRDSARELSLDEKMVLARQSDVYLMLDLGRIPVDGVADAGVKVYEQLSENSSEYVESIRQGADPAYASNAVGDLGGTRVLGESTRKELAAQGVKAPARTVSKVLTLGEAPQAGLLVELGSVGSADDLTALGDAAYRDKVAVALARSVAGYLAQKADNAAVLPSDGGVAENGQQQDDGDGEAGQ